MNTKNKPIKKEELIDPRSKHKTIKWQIISILGLNLVYVFVIAEAFSYNVNYQFEFSYWKLILGSSILLSCLFIGSKINRQYYFAVWNVIFLYILGGEVIYFQYNPDANVTQLIIVYISLVFIYLFSRINIKIRDTRTIKGSDTLLGWISIIMILPFIVFFYDNVNLNVLLLKDVYDSRGIYRTQSNVYTAYTLSILSRVILPLLIIKKAFKKQYVMMSIYILMIIYLYMSVSIKSVFIGLVAILFFYKGSYAVKTIRFVKSIAFLTFGGLFAYLIFDNLFLLDAFGRRVFFTPPALANIYYDFFKGNYTYLSHSPFGLGIVEYPYHQGITSFVGNYVMGVDGLNANVGVYTEGVFSFGFIGGFFAALLVSLIITYFGAIKINSKYFGVVFVYIYYINTSLLSTLLLTHGLFLLMVFAFLFMREKTDLA